MKAEIVIPSFGKHNDDLEVTAKRLEQQRYHEDLSTIVIIPTVKPIHPKVVQSWMNLLYAPNQRVIRIFALGLEVGDAYSQTIAAILADPNLSTWKYVLTIEHDNMPEPDSLLKLYEVIEGKVDGKKYDVVGGLYFTKGESGCAQIWGNPESSISNFAPRIPEPGKIMECLGTGMGFTLYRLDMFKDEKLRKPWFKTLAEWSPGVGAGSATQDLYFAGDARKYGYRFAVDCRAKVGHLDLETGIVW